MSERHKGPKVKEATTKGRLKNPRWEAFAQACAKGMSYSDAYRGTYGTNSKNVDVLSSKLASLVKIGKRIIEIQADAEHYTHLTIQEKRSMYAREGRDRRNVLKDRLKCLRDDSEIAGHIKQAEAGGINVNVSVAMLTEDRRGELMNKKRAAIERRKIRQGAGRN